MWGYADHELSYDGKDYHQLEGIIEWKTRNPKLKIIWSLGGWYYSAPFYEMVSSVSSRNTFIESVIKWLE